MPLDDELKQKFQEIAELTALEIQYKLMSLINRACKVSFKGFIDSSMSDGKIAVKKDSFLLTAPFVEVDGLGPVSMISSNQQVSVIADLVMGGDGNADEDAKPDDTNQMVYSETINQIFKSGTQRLRTIKEGLSIDTGDNEYRSLKAIKDSTLSLPENVDDSQGLEFNFKISAKIDTTFQLELNTKAIEFLAAELSDTVDALDLELLEAKIKDEYATEVEVEEDDTPVQTVIPDSEDAYKVDEKRNLSFLHDIDLDLIVELGRSEMLMKEVLNLTKGSAIELDRQCSEPVDLYVHNQLVARGEVVAIDDCFGLKVTEVVGNLNLSKCF